MQLYCRDGLVQAVHDDDQYVPASAYGDGVTILPFAGPLPEGGLLAMLGKPAPSIDLSAYAAAKRYAVETGGITVDGMTVATDRASQALINGAFNLVTVQPSTTVKFKASGSFVTLDAAAVTAIATAVGQHVQACFSKEADLDAAIAAGTTTTTAQIDAAFAGLAV